MDDRIKSCGFPAIICLGLLKLARMCPFEDAVAGDMVPLFLYIVLYSPQDFPVGDAYILQQAKQIVDAEVPVGTSMAFSAAWRMLRKDLLAREG